MILMAISMKILRALDQWLLLCFALDFFDKTPGTVERQAGCSFIYPCLSDCDRDGHGTLAALALWWIALPTRSRCI